MIIIVRDMIWAIDFIPQGKEIFSIYGQKLGNINCFYDRFNFSGNMMDSLRNITDFLEENKIVIGSIGAGLVSLRILWPALFERRRYPPGPLPLPVIGNGYMMFAKCKGKYRYGMCS